MYTQCPECGVAFRVTAEVLKQAAGQVRCGGCGNAFNALAHLSEQKPAEPVQSEPASKQPVPELTPDIPSDIESDTRPKSISAEQGTALLKTLDQLAGSDIRIEDTGSEWRVLDDDEDEASQDADEFTMGEDEASSIEVLEESFRPIDEGNTEAASETAEPHPVDEMRFDDNTPLPDDFDFANEPPAPAETPAREEPEPAATHSETQVDLAFGEPDEWEDLLGDIVEPAEAATEEPAGQLIAPAEESTPEFAEELTEEFAEELAEELAAEATQPTKVQLATPDQPLDMDTQFAIQAEAMGIDLSGVQEPDDEEMDDDEHETSIEEDLIAAAFETEAAAQTGEHAEKEIELAESEVGQSGEEERGEEEQKEEYEFELVGELEPEDTVEHADDVDVIAAVFDDNVEKAIESIVAELDDEPEADDASDERDVAEMSEEEKTRNLMIDQELFNIAVEDEEGFASTIVQLQPNKKVDKELAEIKVTPKPKRPPVVETIIMEGETVRGEHEDLTTKSRRLDASALSKLRQKASELDAYRDRWTGATGTGTVVGVVALLILLGLQVLHQSREALATVPVFNQAAGPVYRMLGKPLTPTWDVSGWRFEATKGSTDENDELLTIYSRVGNESNRSLPYPLVHVSLTDRFEEIIGSRVLEPGEYLAENADPRKHVPSGNTFNAVISIASPAPEAIGFKLNVCYRLASRQLRCAIEDFK